LIRRSTSLNSNRFVSNAHFEVPKSDLQVDAARISLPLMTTRTAIRLRARERRAAGARAEGVQTNAAVGLIHPQLPATIGHGTPG
jgi:hypothetical protein